MTVHFIGAGPGAADLITLRGRDLLARCPVCLYAGSTVPAGAARPLPRQAPAWSTPPRSPSTRSRRNTSPPTPPGSTWPGCTPATSRSTAPSPSRSAASSGLGIPYTLTPGVPAFAAAAAALGRELTVPEVAQSVVLTRVSGRASAMPPRRNARRLRRHRRDAGHPPRHPRAGPDRRRAAAVLRRRLPGGDRRPRLLARRARPARHAWHDPGACRTGADRAHRPDPGRPRPAGRRLPRQRPLRPRLPAPISRWRGRMNQHSMTPSTLPRSHPPRDAGAAARPRLARRRRAGRSRPADAARRQRARPGRHRGPRRPGRPARPRIRATRRRAHLRRQARRQALGPAGRHHRAPDHPRAAPAAACCASRAATRSSSAAAARRC